MRQSKLKVFNIFQTFYQHTFGKHGQTWNNTSNDDRNTIQFSHYHQTLPETQDIKITSLHVSVLGSLEIQIPRNESTHSTSI